MDVGEYRCTLKEEWLKKARDELNEEEVERLPAIQALREWILQQKWLKTPTETHFLLRFLRVRKFSQLGARTTLENFWRARAKTPEWFKNVSPDDPAILEIIRSGFYIFTPKEDRYGRRLIIERPGVLKMGDIKSKYGLEKVFQAMMCVWDVLAMDERVQVNGFVLLHDGGLSNSDTALAYNMTNMRKCFNLFQKAYPTRIKGLNCYRMPLMFEALLKFCKTLLSDKLSNRLFIHGKSMVSVYEYIDKTQLPKEYLPDNYTGEYAGTIQEITEYMVNEFTKPEVIAHVKDLNSGRFGVDRETRSLLDVPQTSYRKLSL